MAEEVEKQSKAGATNNLKKVLSDQKQALEDFDNEVLFARRQNLRGVSKYSDELIADLIKVSSAIKSGKIDFEEYKKTLDSHSQNDNATIVSNFIAYIENIKNTTTSLQFLQKVLDGSQKKLESFSIFSDTASQVSELTGSIRNFKGVFEELNGLTANLDINVSMSGLPFNANLNDAGGKSFVPQDINNWLKKQTESFLGSGWGDGLTANIPSSFPEVTKTSAALDESNAKASAAASALKSLTSELAKLQLTDAQYQQWQTSQKIADLEKSLGKANPKVKELQALLQNDLEAKFLQSIQEYADPATAQLAKLQKEYQKVLDTVGGSKSLNNAQKNLFNTQAAKQYEKALEGVFLPPVPCTMPRPSASPSRWHPSGPQTKSCWPAFPAAGRI